MHYRLLKSEPNAYPRSQLVADGKGTRDGVRSYQARNNLVAMKLWDLCLFYHSNVGKEVVGICQVSKESYPDPTADDPRRVVVEVAPVRELAHPVTLAQIKSDEKLKDISLLRLSRLSVAPLTQQEFERICAMGN
jgi:predicted RNA-binding protein with PUA-like domain